MKIISKLRDGFSPWTTSFFLSCSTQNQWGVKGDVCEVGVFRGKSLTLLSLLKDKAERLTGFDLFQEDHQNSTEANLENYGDSTLVSLIAGATSEIATEQLSALMPAPVRFLHIDAGHEYHEVMEQLELFAPYLADQALSQWTIIRIESSGDRGRRARLCRA